MTEDGYEVTSNIICKGMSGFILHSMCGSKNIIVIIQNKGHMMMHFCPVLKPRLTLNTHKNEESLTKSTLHEVFLSS